MNKHQRRTAAVQSAMAARQINLDDTIEVDLFAGGGGASVGLEVGLGRSMRVAINHNPKALSMHEANHPHTLHVPEDIWEVDPHAILKGRPIGWLHASPDCTHHSQAAGGQPRKQEIRSLGWVVLKWAALGPVVISMENVKQMQQWSPLIAKRDKATGRVIKLVEVKQGGKTKVKTEVAAPGERVPRNEQYLVPDTKRKGQTWRRWVAALQRLGYRLETRVLNAADYGAATRRNRLYMVARRDGLPIVWPAKTHTQHPEPGSQLRPWSSTADHIDWDRPCPSIFLTKEQAREQGLSVKRPLADATLERIAIGLIRHVLENPKPFVLELANWSNKSTHGIDQPLKTITGWPKGGAFSLVAPYMVQANGGFNTVPSYPVTNPCSTITATGSQQQLIQAFLVHLRRNMSSGDIDAPLPCITARSQHHAVLTTELVEQGSLGLTADQEAGALRVSAFLMRYYSSGGQWGSVKDPMHTITTKDRIALVTVTWQGSKWVIVDIGMRMLTPPELYGCQGFPVDYIHHVGHDGKPLSTADQVLMVGNSVSPPPIEAIARANNPYRYHVPKWAKRVAA